MWLSTAYDYTCQVISLSLLYLNFKDAVHEGDGDRVLSWKYFFLLIWKLLVTEITLVRRLLSCHSTTYCSLLILLNNLTGLGLLMYMVYLVITLAVTSTWSILIDWSRQQWRAWESWDFSVSSCNHLMRRLVSRPSGKHKKKNWDGDLKIIDELSGAADTFKKRTSTVHKSFKLASNVFNKLNNDKMKN